MTRVLVGDFGGLARLGVEELLRAERIEVVHSDGDLVSRLLEQLPDAVVLNLDDEAVSTLARHLCTLFPALTVVACSAVDPTMRVYPRFHHGESYTSPVAAGSLGAAMAGSRSGPTN